MKKILPIILSVFLLGSCANSGWDQETKDLFRQGCMEDAKERGWDDAKAKSVCDCRLEKTMEKYPNMADALEHVDSLANDPDIKACK